MPRAKETSTLDQEAFKRRIFDTGEPPLLIAEAADAHYGDLERAKKMVLAAKNAGADFIKFQHHLPRHEMLKDIPMSSNMKEPLWDFLERNALSIDQHVELSEFCFKTGIGYACTPFSLQAAEELEKSIDLSFYKIGSGEMLDFPTLDKISEFGKPMIVSTGMSSVDEVEETYQFLRPRVETLVLMNCTSSYPTQPAEMHLEYIREMRERYPSVAIGHSEHSKADHFSFAAVTLGARVIERHVTIDDDLEGPDQSVSMNFEDLEIFVAKVQELFLALKVKKEVHPGEEEIRAWAHRSLVYLDDLCAGHVVTHGDIWGKRPGTGVPSRKIESYLGRTLSKDVAADTLLEDSDFLPEDD